MFLKIHALFRHGRESPSAKCAPRGGSASRSSPVAQMPRSGSQHSTFIFDSPSCSGPHIDLKLV